MRFRRPPIERREGRIEFLGEQDGPSEQELKALLRAKLREFKSIQQAYLARIGFAPDALPSVALCITPSTKADQRIVELVSRTFSSLFNSETHLDVVFIDAEQEADLRRVCRPFL